MDHQRGIAYAERTMFSAQSRGARLALASSHREEAVLKTREYLRRLGRATALESMPCVHIAGTKGKGSTCAFTESILRQSGLKTGKASRTAASPTKCNSVTTALRRIQAAFCAGLFVSPHLTTVRERFRINGKPVATEVFLRCFWRVWDTLRAWRHREPSETEMMEAAGACVKQGADSKAGGSSWNPLAAADLVQPAVPGFFHLATLVAFEIFIGKYRAEQNCSCSYVLLLLLHAVLRQRASSASRADPCAAAAATKISATSSPRPSLGSTKFRRRRR